MGGLPMLLMFEVDKHIKNISALSSCLDEGGILSSLLLFYVYGMLSSVMPLSEETALKLVQAIVAKLVLKFFFQSCG